MLEIFSNIGTYKGKQGLKNYEGKLSSTWNSISSQTPGKQEGRSGIFRYTRFISGVCVCLQVIENQENGLNKLGIFSLTGREIQMLIIWD